MAPAALASRLRERSCCSSLVVVGEEPDLELLLGLAEFGVDAYLPWRRATPLGVFCCLMPVLQAGFKVLTERAMEELVLVPRRRQEQCLENLQLTQLESVVLHGVASGLTERQIARHTPASLATVGRAVDVLKEKLGVTSHHMLVPRAIALGFARPDQVGQFTHLHEAKHS